MASTYLSLRYHVVFGTKERHKLTQAWRQSRLHENLSGTVDGLYGVSEGIGGVAEYLD